MVQKSKHKPASEQLVLLEHGARAANGEPFQDSGFMRLRSNLRNARAYERGTPIAECSGNARAFRKFDLRRIPARRKPPSVKRSILHFEPSLDALSFWSDGTRSITFSHGWQLVLLEHGARAANGGCRGGWLASPHHRHRQGLSFSNVNSPTNLSTQFYDLY